MKKVLYVTNLPAPYKVTFFNLLSREMELTVVYERKKAADRDAKWKSDSKRSYEEIYLHGKNIGMESSISLEILKLIKKNQYDAILMNGYSSPTAVLAIAYMRMCRIKYALVCDGILPGKESAAKYLLKKFVISGADFWLSSGELTDQQLIRHGAQREKIYWYPFTSVSEADVITKPYSKEKYKQKIGCPAGKMILYAGQLIERKGIDILMEAYKRLNMPDTQLYIITSRS